VTPSGRPLGLGPTPSTRFLTRACGKNPNPSRTRDAVDRSAGKAGSFRVASITRTAITSFHGSAWLSSVSRLKPEKSAPMKAAAPLAEADASGATLGMASEGASWRAPNHERKTATAMTPPKAQANRTLPRSSFDTAPLFNCSTVTLAQPCALTKQKCKGCADGQKLSPCDHFLDRDVEPVERPLEPAKEMAGVAARSETGLYLLG